MADEFFDDGDTSQSPPAGNSSNATTDKIAEQIASEAPQVQPHAISAAMEKEPEPTEAPASSSPPKVDKNGVAFDPQKHTGTLLKSGAWRERKSTLGKLPARKKGEKEIAAVDAARNSAMASGMTAAEMLTGSMTMLFGDEWAARSEKDVGFDEKKYLGETFGNYFAAKNITDIPPGAALSLALLGYFASRATMPKTQSKLSRIKSWFALRIAARKLRKEFAKRNIIARVEIVDGKLLVDGAPHDEKK